MIKHSLLFDRFPPRLETVRRGPILQVVASREKDGGAVCRDADGNDRHPGDLLWWSDAPAPPRKRRLRKFKQLPRNISESKQEYKLGWNVITASDLPALVPASFEQVKKAAWQLGQGAGARAKTEAAGCHLCKDQDLPQGFGAAQLRQLRNLFAAADGDANSVQRQIFGNWLPGLNWPKKPKKLRPGTLLFYASAVPVATLFLEIFTELGRQGLWLVLYLSAIVIPLLGYHVQRWRGDLQSRYQDHRALAEGLRVQFHWSAAGLPMATCDSYLRHQSGLLGWIRLALQGPALLGLGAAIGREPDSSFITAYWIKDQINYFKNESVAQARAARRLRAWTRATIGMLLLIASLLTVATIMLRHFPEFEPAEFGEWLLISLGVFPAVAGFFIIIAEGRAFEDRAHAYEMASSVFKEAMRQAEVLAEGDLAGWKALILALGQEALTENAAWIAAHRSRPVANHVG